MEKRSAVVVGASRGLGAGVAHALAQAGRQVVTVSRTAASSSGVSDIGVKEIGDASDPDLAATLIDRHRPDELVIVAGATPPLAPLSQLTWDEFSGNWHADVQIAFRWLQAALRQPLAPGSRVVVFSSGAALAGSPLSGGYAGSKAAQRFMTNYAQEEAQRSGLDLIFTAVLPKITPATDLGRPAVAAYATYSGVTLEQYVERLGAPVTPESAGAAVVSLLTDPALKPAYLLTGDGLAPLP